MHRLPKPRRRVRFPYAAPRRNGLATINALGALGLPPFLLLPRVQIAPHKLAKFVGDPAETLGSFKGKTKQSFENFKEDMGLQQLMSMPHDNAKTVYRSIAE